MMYKITATKQFRKEYKKSIKRGLDINELKKVVNTLASGEGLDIKYKDHELIGNYSGFRECHIKPDWLLIYKIEHDKLVLVLSRTGTHSDLF